MVVLAHSSALIFIVIPSFFLLSSAFTPPTSRANFPKSHIARSNNHRHKGIDRLRSCRLWLALLNLVPISEAWCHDVSNERPPPFSALVPLLGCRALSADGVLTRASPDGDDDAQQYRLYLATEFDDLPPIAELTIDVFDTTAITLSSTSDWSAFERAVAATAVEPVVGMYNAYGRAVAYTEVLSGLRRRMRNRLADPGDAEDADRLAPLMVPGETDSSSKTSQTKGKTASLENIAARSSLILALARHPANPSSSEGGRDVEVVASVELRLQPTDAKIPFSQPWLDKLERKLARLVPFSKEEAAPVVASATSKARAPTAEKAERAASPGGSPPLRPYLCNLAVAPSLRSLGVGRALCRVVEAVARDKWGYAHLYLHVDPANAAALALYEGEGYVDVGRRWNAVWAGGASGIGYFVKRLGKE